VSELSRSGETRYTGRSVPRREDPRLLTGRGLYTGDLRLPGMVDAAFVRSPHAHARLQAVDVAAARAREGVLAAVTAADMGPAARGAGIPALAAGAVHYVGQPVAAVVAADRYVAEDGADAVVASYEPLPAVVDLEAALAEGAPLAREGLANNLAQRWEAKYGDWSAAVAAADMIVKEDLVIHRAAGHPLEGRALVAAPDPASGGLIAWAAVQSAHGFRSGLCAALGLPEHRVRVITPDVGGGFGVKNGVYPEDVVVAWLALHLRRPVRWLEDRREHFLGCVHEREQVQHLEAAVRRDGTVLGVRARVVADVGPYAFRGSFIGNTTLATLPGPYRIPVYDGACDVVFTNKVPTGPYRGAGRPQGNFAMERLMDAVARATGLDRAEVRRRNLIRPSEMPYRRELPGGGRVYDTGDYVACLDLALERADAAGFPARQAAARAQGRYLGLGIAVYNEDTGGGPFESARVRMEPSGRVVCATGSPSQGQGHETVWAQLLADELGVPVEDVTVIGSDTAAVPMGIGTFGSRSAAVAGGAVTTAGRRLADKIRRLAAGRLEARPEDLVLAHGRVEVRGAPGRGLAMAEVARMAHGGALPPGMDPGLEETVYFRPERQTFANGAHVVEVEVDPATGGVRFHKYTIVHDCGTLLNPMLVEGQIHGGTMYGLSTALLEEIAYDGSGQLLTATFMDYLLPTTMDVPHMDVTHLESPTPLNPNGAKGAGEGGTIPALAAVASAVEDALRPLGGPVVRELPLTPPRVHALAHGAGRQI
jgi:carbon-monoxide dehydrogenase large subunit